LPLNAPAFGGRAPPGAAWGAYSTPPDFLAGLKGEGKEIGKREGEEMKKPEDPPMSEVR